jgi:DNA gyrase/topoisomerase IV subunit B
VYADPLWGLSAMSGVVSGLSAADRNLIGIYALKGKSWMLDAKILKKYTTIKKFRTQKILGLENGRDYKTIEDVNRHLRYSKIMILTDSDVDGSHRLFALICSTPSGRVCSA